MTICSCGNRGNGPVTSSVNTRGNCCIVRHQSPVRCFTVDLIWLMNTFSAITSNPILTFNQYLWASLYFTGQNGASIKMAITVRKTISSDWKLSKIQSINSKLVGCGKQNQSLFLCYLATATNSTAPPPLLSRSINLQSLIWVQDLL